MSKDNVLEYPKLDNEVITIKGFLNLEAAKMETGTITVLIGEQASGKSILAKLQYFFWKYQNDLFDRETISKKTIADHNKSQIDEFSKLFSITNKNSKPFKIEYKSNDIEICIERTNAGHKSKITASDFLEKFYAKVKRVHIKYSKLEPWNYSPRKKEYEKARQEYEKITKAYHALDEKLDKFHHSVPSVLYVPAARSFFSTIEDNVFAFLAKGKEALDPLIVQFGDFYKSAKRTYQRGSMYETGKNSQQGATIIRDILKGEFIQENDEDIIRTDWGDVELRHASSGQQEALPLILSLLYFPSSYTNNQLIIIEEPEAHLFPIAQKRILEEIVKVAQDRSCSVLIATHSPYILSCLNLEIHKAKKNKKLINILAYYARKQKLDGIYDIDDDLIDLSEFDKVSTAISNEFIEALDD